MLLSHRVAFTNLAPKRRPTKILTRTLWEDSELIRKVRELLSRVDLAETLGNGGMTALTMALLRLIEASEVLSMQPVPSYLSQAPCLGVMQAGQPDTAGFAERT